MHTKVSYRFNAFNERGTPCLVSFPAKVGIPMGRVRYHAANVTVRVPIDDTARDDLRHAVAEARRLREATERPPVTDNERLCARCSEWQRRPGQ